MQAVRLAASAPSEEQLAAQLGHSDVAEAPSLELRLRNVLRLRQEGQASEAERQLAALRKEYPERNLDAELERLQGTPELPGSAR